MAAGSAAYHWVECPHCAAQPPYVSVLGWPQGSWNKANCHVCHRPFEVRLTPQAMFEIRQLAPAGTSEVA